MTMKAEKSAVLNDENECYIHNIALRCLSDIIVNVLLC